MRLRKHSLFHVICVCGEQINGGRWSHDGRQYFAALKVATLECSLQTTELHLSWTLEGGHQNVSSSVVVHETLQGNEDMIDVYIVSISADPPLSIVSGLILCKVCVGSFLIGALNCISRKSYRDVQSAATLQAIAIHNAYEWQTQKLGFFSRLGTSNPNADEQFSGRGLFSLQIVVQSFPQRHSSWKQHSSAVGALIVVNAVHEKLADPVDKDSVKLRNDDFDPALAEVLPETFCQYRQWL